MVRGHDIMGLIMPGDWDARLYASRIERYEFLYVRRHPLVLHKDVAS